MCEHDDFKREGDKCEICPEDATGNKPASVMGSRACANRRAAIIVGVDCSNDDADTLTLEFPKGLISGVKTDDPVEVLYFTYKP